MFIIHIKRREEEVDSLQEGRGGLLCPGLAADPPNSSLPPLVGGVEANGGQEDGQWERQQKI